MSKSDPEIDSLAGRLQDDAELLAALMAELAVTTSPSRKAELQRMIRAAIARSSRETRVWAEAVFGEVADDEDQKLGLLFVGTVFASGLDQFVQNADRQLSLAVTQANRSVLRFASQIASGGTKTLAANGFKVSSKLTGDELQRSLRSQLRDGFIQVLGRNGRIVRYSYDYYTSLQAFTVRQHLIREITINRTVEAGYDLVQISGNPSTVGDFCDLYRGKVFSISGTHTFYSPLAETPNGGPPFHPWCRHTAAPFMEDDLDEVLRNIPETMRDLGRHRGVGTAAFQKAYEDFLNDGE